MTDYEQYCLNWLIDHNHSLPDLMNEMEEYRKNTATTNIVQLFKEWENDIGFHGEIYACEDEYYDYQPDYDYTDEK